MKSVKFLYLVLFFMFSSFTYAAGARSCSGTFAGSVHGATTDAFYSDTDNSTGPRNYSGFYRFRTQIDGEITITMDQTSGTRHRVYIGRSCGGSQIFYRGRTTNFTHTFNVVANQWYYVRIRERNRANRLRYRLSFDFTATSLLESCPGEVINNLEGTSVSATDSASNVTVPSYTTYYYHFTPTATGTIQVNSSANRSYNSLYIQNGCGSTLWSDTANSTDKSSPEVAVTAGQQIVIAFERRYSSSINVDLDFTYTVPIATAVNDDYTTTPGVQLSVDAASGLLVNDKGADITITDINTTALQGTIDSYDATTGAFMFTPAAGFTGTTSFDYTITDGSGNTSTATVNITVVMTTDFDSSQEFVLVNPQNTRNIIGDYKIGGNTVLCLTTKRHTFAASESECVDTTSMSDDATSNNYIAKFIDIDGDSSTWNSSSSYITLPNSYKQVLWAGLFWQGRFAESSEDIHYGRPNGGSYNWVDTGNYDAADFDKNFLETGPRAQNILLKIDNGTYQSVQASKVHYDQTDVGITYSARADVTQLLRQATIAAGDDVTFTIGNLPTSEGREPNPGIFGGWSLLVIYAEDIILGKPRSIAVHAGMTEAGQGGPINITGFKLPSSGSTVTASLSVFSGEGEFDYRTDGIYISSNTDATQRDMPGATDPTNIFDAKMDGINRVDIAGHKNNLQNNNVGVEVDNFDLSALVSSYDRKNTDTIILDMYSNQDYIVPGMLVFKTELYQPSVCYDYTLEAGGYVIPSEHNEINTTIGSYTSELMITRISLQSKEGDFNFNDVNLTYALADTTDIRYAIGTTMIAEDGENFYTASAQTTNESTEGFLIYLGKGASNSSGGVVEPYQKRFIKFENDIKDKVDTKFGLLFQCTIDYGSGPAPMARVLTWDDICKDTPGYYIASDIFNVTSRDANNGTGKPYNLYTQVVNRPFSAKVFSHDLNYINSDHRLSIANTAVEIEAFNADYYPRDANLSCTMPDSNISSSTFVDFNNQSSTQLTNFTMDRAARNAGFRIWYLARPNGTLVNNHCTDPSQQSCYNTLYNTEFKSFETSEKNCTTTCNGAEGCYGCIKGYYGAPICSKDNFSVRPEAFVAELSDNNQTEDSTLPNVLIANSGGGNGLSKNANVVAAYKYRLDVNATSYTDDAGVKGYYRELDNNSSKSISIASFNNAAALAPFSNDISDRNFTTTLFDGTNINQKYDKNLLVAINQVGAYSYIAKDSNWTVVDYDSSVATHHTGAGFNNNTPDCLLDDGSVSATGRPGCEIHDNHLNNQTSTQYTDLGMRMYPYDFATSLTFSAPMQDDKNTSIVYINTLDSTKDYPFGYKDTGDKNMSFNVQGGIYAAGWHPPGGQGVPLSNFVDNSFAENVTMGLRHQYLSPIPTSEFNLTADLQNHKSTDNSEISREQKTFTDSYTAGSTTQSDLTQQSAYFTKDMNGSVTMDLGYNFDRDFGSPMNPRKLKVEDFNITLSTQPTTLFVDGISNHKVATKDDIDQNITFVYARAKPSLYYYDDITSTSVKTPISVEAYCDLGYTQCQNRGIDAADSQTANDSWWRMRQHNNITDNNGIIGLVADFAGASVTSPVLIDAGNNGINTDINVTRPDSATLPLIVPINLDIDASSVNYTDRWLIHNREDDNNSVPDPFHLYDTRFISNPGALWTGHGKTGHVVGGDINTKKTKRMEW